MNNTNVIIIYGILIILIFLVMSQPSYEKFEPIPATTSDNPATRPGSNHLLNTFEKYRQDKNVPGMQVYILKDNEKIFSSNHSARNVPIWDTEMDIIVHDDTL